MNYFHIGADEVFNFGTCNETINLIQKLGSRDKAFSWHVYRTANFVKKQFASVCVFFNFKLVTYLTIGLGY